MIDKYTAQAPTAEAAIEKGLKALGLKRKDADIEIMEPGKKGFLGIGQRDAVVVVKRKTATNIMEEVFSSHPLNSESRLAASEKTTERSGVSAASATELKKDDEKLVAEPITEQLETEKEIIEELNKVESIETIETEDIEGTEEAGPVISEEETKAKTEKDKEGIQFVADYLKDIANKMGIEDVTVHVSKEGKKVRYNIETEDAGLVIGRHGKVLNSLQTLAQIQLHQVADTKFFAKVDAEDYRDRRQKTVEQLAKRTADKVKRSKSPVILEPMPAHERKLIHRYLNHHKGIQTHSEGKEPHRYLVVEPEE